MKCYGAVLWLVLLPVLAHAHPSWGVVVDSRGNVFYSDLKQVWMIEPSGRTTMAVPNVHTHELYVDADDALYGEHLWYEGDRTGKWGHRVWRRTREGRMSDVIPASEGFRRHYSFVRDRAGNMYWPADQAGDENGTGLLPRVTAPIDRLAGRDPMRHAVMGLCVDAAGDVYLAATGVGSVKKVSQADGSVRTVYRSGAPFAPTGVALAGDTLLVLETAGSSVRVRQIDIHAPAHQNRRTQPPTCGPRSSALRSGSPLSC